MFFVMPLVRAAGPAAGVNIISVGNTYSDPQFQGAAVDRLFSDLKGALGLNNCALPEK